jgi:hypothetical protein
VIILDNELQHFGIKGMKWGVRRYQNKDGSLTPAGKKRYDESDEEREKKEKSKKTKVKVATAAVATAAVATTAAMNKDKVKKGAEFVKANKPPKGEKKEATVEDYKESLKKTQSADKALQGIKEIVNKADDVAYAKKVRNDLTQMTDKELQQAVNRLNMEERYSQVMQQRHKIDRGESKVNQILDVAGDVVSGAVTALTIAVAIKELTKK